MNDYLNPVGAMIELTSRCNLNCSHCYNANDSRPIRDISDCDWVEVIRNLCMKGIGAITFSGGEPFIRRELLLKLIMIVAEYPNTRIYINTNGTNVPESFLNELMPILNRVVFQVSVDSAFPEQHDKVRRIKGAWEKSIHTCKLINNMEFDLRIAHTVNRINVNSVEQMIALCIYLGASLLGIGAAVPLGRGKQDADHIILPIEERQKLHNEIEKFAIQYKGYIDIRETSEGGPDYYKDYLNYHQDWMIISAEGNVKLENRLPYIVGSVQKMSLDELWRRVNYYQKSECVVSEINRCIVEGDEIDSQQYVYLP